MNSAGEAPVGQEETKPGVIKRLQQHLGQEIDESWSDVVLILSCAITGLMDSSVYNVYTCFVSMQTGNTVYVGLGVSGQPASSPYRGLKALDSIICFLVGAFFFGRLSQIMQPLRRQHLVLSWMLQAILIFTSAGLIFGGLIPPGAADDKDLHPIIFLPIGLLSFQAAGQIVQSRVLEFTEIPTIVLTSTYCDLMLDPHLFVAGLREDSKRNRRVLSIIALVLGAIAGGALTKHSSIVNALWICGAAKVACAVAWLFWKAKSSIRLE